MRPHGNHEQLENRRCQAIALLRKGHPYREVAQKVKASLSSVVRWQQTYRKKGRKGIRSRACWGRPCRLSPRQKEDLKQRLLKGAGAAGHATELWTLKRIARLIGRRYRMSYTTVGVWKLLRCQMGWSCQKPERRALERNEKDIARWKNRVWLHIKKSQKTGRPSRVSG